MIKSCLIILLWFSSFLSINSTHFRGGSITWKPLYPQKTKQQIVEISLTQRYVWRRFSETCDDVDIKNKKIIGDATTLQCLSSCPNVSSLPNTGLPCVAYSNEHDWSAAEASTVINVPKNMSFEIAYKGSAWISNLIKGADGTWSVSANISTIPRWDGSFNTPPISSMSSIKRIRFNVTEHWRIPVTDADQDIVRCRWAKSKPVDECAGVCGPMPNAILNEKECLLTFTANQSLPTAIALKIEDYESHWSETPLSSTSLQFLVFVDSNKSTCDILPFYHGSQPDRSCVMIPVEMKIEEMAQFSSGCENLSIIEIEKKGPNTMTFGSLTKHTKNSYLYNMNFTWTPTKADIGSPVFVCFTPTDSDKRQGAQACIEYRVYDKDEDENENTTMLPNEFVNGSMNPFGPVPPNQNQWEIEYTNIVEQPSQYDAYIRFYSASTNTEVYSINVRNNTRDVIYSNTTLIFYTQKTWTLGQQYYILFDRSLVTDATVCGPQSPAIQDPQYWTFEISNNYTNCYAPTLTLTPPAVIFNSRSKFCPNQTISVNSKIQMNCYGFSSIIIQWTIKQYENQMFMPIDFDPSITTNAGELKIPRGGLSLGIYELTLTVTMEMSSNLHSSIATYIEMIPCTIEARLVALGTLMITRGHLQELILDPGQYSHDLDENPIIPSNWSYEYQCRIYGNFQLKPMIASANYSNTSCFAPRSDDQPAWYYVGPTNASESAVKITAGSLQLNHTYEFMVHMVSRSNYLENAIAYLLVQVANISSPLIAVSCVLSRMCIPEIDFQYINPATQIALFSICVENCSSSARIQWNIYHGHQTSNNLIEWSRFNATELTEINGFFGTFTSNFTAAHKFLMNYLQWEFWRFEVVYTFENVTSTSALNFRINHSPSNGSCKIQPLNGTTQTRFHISCENWFDNDDIIDYALYMWTNDSVHRVMVGFFRDASFDTVLPAGNPLHLVIRIRDEYLAATEWTISSIYVTVDPTVADIINNLSNSNSDYDKFDYLQNITGNDLNGGAQLILILTQELSKMNLEALAQVASSNTSSLDLFVLPLTSSDIPKSSNGSTVADYRRLMNNQAKINTHLIQLITSFPSSNINMIQMIISALQQLTRNTNQLTRPGLIEAAETCQRLAEWTYKHICQMTYEDLDTITSFLGQTISNIITAINGPLQKRTQMLSSDWSEINDFPVDYQTDLDFEWSNPHLFAENDDFSEETIANNRYRFYQQRLANQMQQQRNDIIRWLSLAWNLHLNINQTMVINTSSILIRMQKLSVQSLRNKSLVLLDNTRVDLNVDLDEEDIIILRVILQPLAPAATYRLTTNTKLSRLLSVSILDRNANELHIRSKKNRSIVALNIPLSAESALPEMIQENPIEMNITGFLFRSVELGETLGASIHFQLRPVNHQIGYLFIYKFKRASIWVVDQPEPIDGWDLFCPMLNGNNDEIFTLQINHQHNQTDRYLVYGVRELNSTEQFQFCSNQNRKTSPTFYYPSKFTAHFDIRIFLAGCYYLDSTHYYWQTEGLSVGSETNQYYTECYSTHLTDFAGAFRVIPKPVKVDYVLANAAFNKNKTVYLTLIIVCLIFLLLIIYARYRDKKDLEKLSVIPLADNRPTDSYLYHILVFTGHRKESETKSNVHFILSGDGDHTSIRTLNNSHRSILQAGSIDAFLMACPKSLGPLNYLHIWHDNSGSGDSASWFLKSFIVHDLQTLERFDFICQRWLAVEKDDGLIERALPVAGPLEKDALSHLVTRRVQQNIVNDHLWFSIFFRNPSLRFSRVQRCTCCFVLLYLSMCLNILYYDLTVEAKSHGHAGFSVGSISITLQQVIISLIIELISLIPSLLVVQCFRRSRSRHWKEIRSKSPSYCAWTLPWWCVYLAYGLSFILISMSILIILARGIEFGEEKSQQWLISIGLSFVSSLFLIQPLKVLTLSIFFVCLTSKSKEDDQETKDYLTRDGFHLSHDEQYNHSTENLFYEMCRLDKYQLASAREMRLKEIRMWSLIREAWTYTLTLFLLIIIVYPTRDGNAFLQVKHLQRIFLHSKHHPISYSKVSTIDDYWTWLETSFVKNIRAGHWYNQGVPKDLRGFISDKSNRLIGQVMMRQLRISSSLCVDQRVQSICHEDYSFTKEDKNSYHPGWTNRSATTFSSSLRRAFQYQSKQDLNTNILMGNHRIYDSGGYIYLFGANLSDFSLLRQYHWIDHRTRAVIIEMNFYNPNVGFFTSMKFISEFLSTGSISSAARVDPIDVQNFPSIFQWIVIGIYFLLIIHFMIVQSEYLFVLKWNYFRRFWSLIELALIVCSWTAMIVYARLYRERKSFYRLFEEKVQLTLINFQSLIWINELFICLIGFCCFLATLRFLRLCRFHSHLRVFIATITAAREKLISFLLMFSIFFTSLLSLFYGLFLSKIDNCSNLAKTAQMLIEMILLTIDGKKFYEASSILGPIALSAFAFLTTFIGMNIFILIIMDSFRQMKSTVHEDHEMISFMIDRLRRWTEIKISPNRLKCTE